MSVRSVRRRRIVARFAAAAAVLAVPAAMVAAPAMAAPVASSSPIQLIDNDWHHCNQWDRDDFCRDHGPGDWHHRRGGDWDRDGDGSAPTMPSTGSAL
ncbi:hypothetical protein [Nocardia sp. JCM 34519.1]|nr:hypothetical protein [Nocardia sp. JCM 34519.1]